MRRRWKWQEKVVKEGELEMEEENEVETFLMIFLP